MYCRSQGGVKFKYNYGGDKFSNSGKQMIRYDNNIITTTEHKTGRFRRLVTANLSLLKKSKVN